MQLVRCKKCLAITVGSIEVYSLPRRTDLHDCRGFATAPRL